MFNDSINVSNKIITHENLIEIFDKMNEKLVYYKKINDNEEKANSVLSFNYQKWTFKDSASKLKFDVHFYDRTNIEFDDYNNFLSVFNNRLEDIHRVYVYFNLSYSVSKDGGGYDNYFQHINMAISDDDMTLDVSLSSDDKKMDDIYELIKNIILAAPPKYDDIIKKKGLITNIVGLGIGFIPALIITILLIFVPAMREIFAKGIVVYPIITFLIAFIIGTVISYNLLDKYYKSIVPEKKYAGYNPNTYNSIYKDDIDKFVGSSEILIGKNVHNMDNRTHIRAYYDKYKKWIPIELIVMVVFSIFVLFLGRI